MKLKELTRLIAPDTELVLNDRIHKKECKASMLSSLQDNVLNFDIDSISVMKDHKNYKLVLMLAGYILVSKDGNGKYQYYIDGGDTGGVMTILSNGKRFPLSSTHSFDDALKYDWLFTSDESVDIMGKISDLDVKSIKVLSSDKNEILSFIDKIFESSV